MTAGGLAALAASLAPPFALAGIAVAHPGAAPAFHVATAPGWTATEATLWRAASLSKVVTARSLAAVAGPGVWDRDASDALGFALRHPAHPDIPVTLGQVASHRAGLSDDAGYAIPAGTSVEAWLAARGPACWHPDAPGTALRYANLGSVLLALAAERAGGATFDRLARTHVLGPLGIEGGFAWSGVPPARRADRLPALRRTPAGFVPQVDAAVAPDGPSANDGTPFPPAPPGENPSPLGPQGGLRLSLAGALALARTMPDAVPRNGPSPDGMLAGAAPGALLVDDPSLYPRPLVGHFADAYGILAGAWRDPATGTAFAYVLNGLPEGDEGDGWRAPERAIFAALA